MKIERKRAPHPGLFLSPEEVAAELGIDITARADRDLMQALIVVATLECEEREGRAFVLDDFEARLDGFPMNGAPITLTFGPVVEITSLAYRDSSGLWRNMRAEEFEVHNLQSRCVYINATDCADWPPIGLPHRKRPKQLGVLLNFRAGHAETPQALPERWREMLLVAIETEIEERRLVRAF